jgi:hypothetical protein
MPTRTSGHLLLLLGLALLAPRPAAAQPLPSAPLSLADGRVMIGGELSMSGSTDADTAGWFNYTDYEHNALRLLRLGLVADVRLGSRVSVLAQLRTDNWDALQAHALYVRVRPWAGRAFDIQAGRIPPTFGAFPRRSYAGTDNPVIGYPLAYQYLTSLRSDAVPATADDLLRMRGIGWRPRFPIGSQAIATGLPLVTAFRWDTGVQVRIGSEPVEVSAAVTAGTLSAPHVRDDNHGRQVVGRIVLRPLVGLVVGVSGARGPFLADSVTSVLPSGTRRRLTQRAFGVDAEYSRGYGLIRAEGIVSDWRLPAVDAPSIDAPVRAWAISVEGKYSLWPGVFGAGRYDYLGFSDLRGSAVTEPWDAPVRRLEVGGGYYLQRNLIGKVTYQHNWRASRFARQLGVWAGQVQLWF